jgi:hypothetical protein
MMLGLMLRASMYLTVLSWMQGLVPGDHRELAAAVADEARTVEEAALITAVAFRESTFRKGARGDHGRSVCEMQVFGGSPALLEDTRECVRVGARMLRESVRVDPSHPVAQYARGPRWRSDEARRISDDRVRVAKRLLAPSLILSAAATTKPSDAAPRGEVTP